MKGLSLSFFINFKDNNAFETLEKYVTESHSKYINSNYSRKVFDGIKPILCIIIGIESFKGKLSDENKTKFGSFFEKGKDLGIINFIIVDSIDKIKKNEFESWYKTIINSINGIWIGNGINDQFTLKISQKTKEMKEEILPSFAFIIKHGKPILVKCVEKIDLNVKS